MRDKAEAGDLLFGNMDTWVLWNMTGGPEGGVDRRGHLRAHRLHRRQDRAEAFGQLAAGVMHDVNNALMVISATSSPRAVLEQLVLVHRSPLGDFIPAHNRPACSDQTRCSRRKVKGKTGHDAALD
jgi:hypothetical protein